MFRHSNPVSEFPGIGGIAPAGQSQWLALAEALDEAIVTLHTAVPDPLWFGPSRRAFDSTAEEVMNQLRQARWEVLPIAQGCSP
ncbi:MAG: hypothetical protein RL720_520 [Actinomycetota bacterium]|jgi:hypothetical protein